MKVFILVLFLILISSSNCAQMTKVEIGKITMTSLYLSTNKETYFYVENTHNSGNIYFHFFDYTTTYSIIDVCYTNTNPDKWNSSQDCYSNRNLTLQKSQQRVSYLLEEFYKYNLNIKRDYLIIKYKVAKTEKGLQVMVSYSNLYDYEPHDSAKKDVGDYLMTFAFMIVIGVPLAVASPIIIIIIISIYLCCKKYIAKKSIDYSQSHSKFVVSNSVAYHLITQGSISQEKLFFSKHL